MTDAAFKVERDETGLTFIETKCPGRNCKRPYRIDEHHPAYAEVKAALARRDRSVLFCYHKVDYTNL